MSGSNLKVSNPYPRPRRATFPWKPRPPPLAIFANAVFLNSGSEKTFGYPRHAPSLVTASGGLSA